MCQVSLGGIIALKGHSLRRGARGKENLSMADGDNLVMGQFNSSNAETHIARSTYSYGGPVPIHSAALDVTNVDGTGVRAYSPNREAVYGHGGETGVYGYSAGSTGVHGRSPYGTGVTGLNIWSIIVATIGAIILLAIYR